MKRSNESSNELQPIEFPLKMERELRGVSLAELSEATKIPISQLRAFEAHQFNALHGSVFIKGIIRSYINYLGLDPDIVMLDFEYLQHSRGSRESIRPEDEGRNFNAIPVIGFIIVLAVLLIWVSYPRSRNRVDSPTQVSDSTVQQIPGNKKSMEKILAAWCGQEISIDSGGNRSKTGTVQEALSPLVIIAQRATWIQLTYPEEGKRILAGIFPGETHTVSIESPVNLEIGDTGAVTILAGNKQLRLPDSGYEKICFHPGPVQSIIEKEISEDSQGG